MLDFYSFMKMIDQYIAVLEYRPLNDETHYDQSLSLSYTPTS